VNAEGEKWYLVDTLTGSQGWIAEPFIGLSEDSVVTELDM